MKRFVTGVVFLIMFVGFGASARAQQSSGKTPPGYYDVTIAWLKKRVNVR